MWHSLFRHLPVPSMMQNPQPAGTLSEAGISPAKPLGEYARAVPQFHIGVLRSW